MNTSPCTCVLDSDGRCPPCREQTRTLSRALSAAMKQYMTEIESLRKTIPCRQCYRNYADEMMAGIIRAWHKDNVPFETIHAVAQSMAMGMRMEGIVVLPQLEKILKEISP